ncbi:MAG: DUF2183 domain-containing protein [Woeseiaceae bacterium]|nr:DUF2183 domain-containing protein [Woeseiaceae bacterium]
MRILWIVGFLVIIGGYALLRAAGNDPKSLFSDIKDDEFVQFFNSTAWFDAPAREWHVPVRGWIYEPEDSTLRRAVFEKILREKYALEVDEAAEANFARRLNLIIADNERAKSIVIDIAGRREVLPASEPNGHFGAVLVIPEEDMIEHASHGFLHYAAVTRPNDTREFAGAIRLVESSGLSIISDIDDTVKVSMVTDRKALLDYAFLRDFQAAPGMAEWYREWVNDDVSLHFVSSSPWQLYAPLKEFLDDHGFPWANLNLKLVRFRDETLFDLFKKGTETKPATIREILGRYPDRDFVLVGDSGEQDPEVYAGLLREYPQQVKKAYIRNVTNETPDNERFAAVFDGIDADRWVLFDHPKEIAD